MVNPTSPMLHTKSLENLLVLEKSFTICDQDHLIKLSFPHPKESLYMKIDFNWPSGFRG